MDKIKEISSLHTSLNQVLKDDQIAPLNDYQIVDILDKDGTSLTRIINNKWPGIKQPTIQNEDDLKNSLQNYDTNNKDGYHQTIYMIPAALFRLYQPYALTDDCRDFYLDYLK
ncbi:MAG: hypothetical protein WCP19_06525 [Chloroflexota bacterium]